jgi:hypothetical protein
MKKLKNIPLYLAIIAVMSTTSWANRGSQIVPEESWLSVPSSPLEIRFSPSKRDLALLNRSSGKIIRYRLGCVVQEASKIRVVRKMPFIDANLESGKVVINAFTVYADDLERCGKKKSGLAVVEVVFLDGSIWKAK